LCGAQGLKLCYTQGNSDEFRFYRCPQCLLVNYDLATGLNQEKYAQIFRDPLDENLPMNRRKNMVFKVILRHIKPPARLMDIGCGFGRLLHLARQAGFEVSGLELSQFHAECIKQRLGISIELKNFVEWNGAPKNHFDVVVLQQVLEHIEDPINAMTQIGNLLKPRGLAILEFPNIDGWDLRLKRLLRRMNLYRRKYPPNYKPGHVNEFCRCSFELLARKTGFEILSWRTYSWKPFTDAVYGLLPIGNKARAVVRKIDQA
jgi:SAM-dependent methyltransferase